VRVASGTEREIYLVLGTILALTDDFL